MGFLLTNSRKSCGSLVVVDGDQPCYLWLSGELRREPVHGKQHRSILDTSQSKNRRRVRRQLPDQGINTTREIFWVEN